MQQYQSQKQAKLFLNKAQSVIEFLISITIFSIAFISLISLVNNYVNALKVSKERIIANFLAQEGLELVIAYRNMQTINGNQGFNSIFPDGTSTYCVDYNLNFTPNNNPCPLYIDQNGFYTHTRTSTSTIFSRLITINKQQDYAIVTSRVEFYNQNVELSTVLTSWLAQ